MKKSFILILALLAGVLMRFGETKGLAAWTASSGSFDTSEYLEAYEPVLDSYRAYLNGYEPGDAIAASDGGYYLELGKTGISELCLDGGDICYELRDLNGDEVPELIISSTTSKYYRGWVYDLFTLSYGVPVRVAVSSVRSRYMLCESGELYYEGNASAYEDYRARYYWRGNAVVMYLGEVRDGGHYYEVYETQGDLFRRSFSDVEVSAEYYSFRVADMQSDLATLYLRAI